MKVIQINPAIGKEDSGPSYSVTRLFEELGKHEIDSNIATLNLGLPDNFNRKNIFTFKENYFNRLGYSKSMNKWLRFQAKSSENLIFHNHGMWQINAIYTSWLKLFHNFSLVISPRGTLSEWSLKNGNAVAKSAFWHLFQKRALNIADCIHATGYSEYEDIRRLGFKNPVAIIPNGIDVDVFTSEVEKEKTLLFLGRIHKKKGLEPLISVWKKINLIHPDWTLKIVGTDEDIYGNKGYKKQLIQIVKSQKIKQIIFSDPLFGEEKFKEYQKSLVFILPTYSENFGMTVIESLSQKTPAIVTHGAPWGDLNKTNSGWWIPLNEESLFETINQALSMTTDSLREMGENGYRLVKESYSWHQIAKNMIGVYRWLNGEIDIPSFIILD